MRIVIMRHGQAEVMAGNDSERPLTDAGVFESSQMSVWLREQIPSFEWVLVSPFKRARQTWNAICEQFPVANVQYCDDLTPSGSAEQVADFITGLVAEEKIEHLLLVSHLPLISFVVEQLVPGSGCPLFHTGEVALIEYDPQTMQASLSRMKSPLDIT